MSKTISKSTGEEQIRRAADAALRRPKIFADQGQLRDKVTQAFTAIELRNDPPYLFSRGGIPVRLRDVGGSEVEELDAKAMLAELADAADWLKRDKDGDKDANPPQNLVQAMLGRRNIPFPLIQGFARAPFFTREGELVVKPGYHAGAQTYLALDAQLAGELGKQTFAMEPTEGEVADARALLLEMICDFPFADKASRAHAIGLALLPFVRRMIDGPTPIHAVVAPPESAGIGKGLLVQTTCAPGVGEVPCTPEVGSNEELRKKLLPVVLENLPVFLFDNVTHELRGGVLASILTARRWIDRILGSSALFRGSVNTTWVVTGNGLRVSTEIRRRTVWVRLDAGCPEPWRRTGFKHDLPFWVYEHRAELIRACITLVQKWIVRGRPAGDVTLGSFEHWASLVGGILKAAGIEGFLENTSDEAAQDADERGARWQGFIEDWWREHRDPPVLPGALVELAYGRSIIREREDGSAEGKERSAATRLGFALKRHAGRAFKIEDDGVERFVVLARALVERAGRGDRSGFALVPRPQRAPNAGDVGANQQSSERPAESRDNLSPNVDISAHTCFSDVGEPEPVENAAEAGHSPTSPTSGGDSRKADGNGGPEAPSIGKPDREDF